MKTVEIRLPKPTCRADGFPVFLDSDSELNQVRISGSIRDVIVAVAIKRARQIALNYAMKYAPELVDEFKEVINESRRKAEVCNR